MNTFVIKGGNSGVGLQSAHKLMDAGHRREHVRNDAY